MSTQNIETTASIKDTVNITPNVNSNTNITTSSLPVSISTTPVNTNGAVNTSSTSPVNIDTQDTTLVNSVNEKTNEVRNLESDEETIRNQKLVEEFQYLLEKSQSLFSGLRDLPPTGSHRQWRPYFEKTFEVYTKLWKFQQTHRSILENKTNYGLKRWEVGEIASKIGQLYYHYYLRTSETNYLHESYVFYEAIHDRHYFKDILEVKNSALMIKKMRYYARFIIVCLLLNKDENIRQLMTELEGLIEDYTKSFKPPDAKEWHMVLEEVRTFTEAEKKLVPINLDRTPDKIEHRLPALIPPRQLSELKLQEAILVGHCQKQIKFSELTLDMYRMLQSLEREPFAKGTQPNKRSNPHKYLLYRPSLSQLLVYISTAFKDTADGSALLLYLSADGFVNSDQTVPGYGGGVVLSRNRQVSDPSPASLHPADLVPFTRKPLFLIVDSDHSTQFKTIPNVFDQPVMCLMSPIDYPSSVQDKSEIGSLFTLFLHTPLLGFCSVSDIGNLDHQKWDDCVKKISAMEKLIGDLLLSDPNVDKHVKKFMSDDFLYYFIVRFVLCGIFLRYHSSFKDEKSFPSSYPNLPDSIYISTEIVTMLGELTAIADVGTYFSLPAYATSTAAPSINTSVTVVPSNASTNTTIISSSPPLESTPEINL